MHKPIIVIAWSQYPGERMGYRFGNPLSGLIAQDADRKPWDNDPDCCPKMTGSEPQPWSQIARHKQEGVGEASPLHSRVGN